MDASRYARPTGIGVIAEFVLSGRNRFVAGMMNSRVVGYLELAQKRESRRGDREPLSAEPHFLGPASGPPSVGGGWS
jgi:hypothetical protein